MTDDIHTRALIDVARSGKGLSPEGAKELAEALIVTRATVAELAAAGNDLCLRLITVKPTLEKPYPDDARWSPWTRFVEPRWSRLGRAVTASWKVVPRRTSSDVPPPITVKPEDEARLIADAKATGFTPSRLSPNIDLGGSRG